MGDLGIDGLCLSVYITHNGLMFWDTTKKISFIMEDLGIALYT